MMGFLKKFYDWLLSLFWYVAFSPSSNDIDGAVASRGVQPDGLTPLHASNMRR